MVFIHITNVPFLSLLRTFIDVIHRVVCGPQGIDPLDCLPYFQIPNFSKCLSFHLYPNFLGINWMAIMNVT